MSENKLLDLSFEFAVAIVYLVDGVTAPKSSYMIDLTTYQYTEKLCGNIRRLLIASCKTAKENAK